MADTSADISGVWFDTGHRSRKFLRFLIVSDIFRAVMLKYLRSDGAHSLGRVPLARHRIASPARRVSPVSTSCALALPTPQRAATAHPTTSNIFSIMTPPSCFTTLFVL